MLARLREAIDSQIASEQAKTRPPSRRPRADSVKGVEKDPSEFEDIGTPASTSPGSRTPVQLEKAMEDPLGAVGTSANNDAADSASKKPTAVAPTPTTTPPPTSAASAASTSSTSSHTMYAELPTEVRVKLRKLEKLDSKYAGESIDSDGGWLDSANPA